ncbi:MAG: bifunctional enoyl-CoA hydratase/phosphate acetyltransferase [candidate division KSB1 bacterium]|jgi:phosphate butyryltransferase|nr:bifunctional enoyl-CoA hydratase/phosphate acetyltransferase [candidate division KSB1 bacterium]
MKMINTFEELIAAVKKYTDSIEDPIRIAVAAGDDEAALSALLKAKSEGIAEGILFGKFAAIENTLEKIGVRSGDPFPIVEVTGDVETCQRAIQSIHDSEADIIMKGRVKSSTLLKAAFHAENGLRSGGIISDTFIFEFPGRSGHNKLLMITDGGFNLSPDLNEKVQIIQNAVQVAHALGNECPRVAVISASETVNPNLQSTVDAALLSKMNDRGQIKGCVVDGPLALDNAISLEAAAVKGIRSDVAGKADIMLFPNIESANATAKGTTYFAGLRQAHATMGAKAPILIPSRNDSADSKFMTIVLNVLLTLKKGRR